MSCGRRTAAARIVEVAEGNGVDQLARRRPQPQLQVAAAHDARVEHAEASVERRLGEARAPRTALAQGHGGVGIELAGLERAVGVQVAGQHVVTGRPCHLLGERRRNSARRSARSVMPAAIAWPPNFSSRPG